MCATMGRSDGLNITLVGARFNDMTAEQEFLVEGVLK